VRNRKLERGRQREREWDTERYKGTGSERGKERDRVRSVR